MSKRQPAQTVMPLGLIAHRFEIGDPADNLIGRGGMGYVYRATDTQTGLPVAVKALKPEIVAEHPDIVARFVREGEALRQLNHPNIVKMIAAIEEGDQHYLVMEYVEGGSLRDLLDRDEPLSIKRALQISLDLADALTRAHRLDIVHRDLKPANVLLAADGTPRLTDFGLARVADSPQLTQADVVMGTVDYLSPEACRGEELDSRTDIWSFGVMLYEMLAGKRPFGGDSTTAKLLTILTQPVPDLYQEYPEIPDVLADLVYRMLEKDRYQRIPSVRLVGAELEAVLQERDSTSPILRAYVSTPSASSRFATPTPPQTVERRHNLPVPPTPFVGREAELTELARLLDDPGVRLVTVVGPGGMGKTRLALEAAAHQGDVYDHGVYFVTLAPLTCASAIVSAIAEALSFQFREGDPRQQLFDYLAAKKMLLVMDNFEHLIEGADLVPDILGAAPGVKALATSRARLNVQGEQLFQIAGMDFPDWETPEDALEYSAVKLFMQSARRVSPEFELQADDLRYVARICRRVEGMPLAILLAASWVEMLTPAEIAAELEKGLDLLESDMRDLPERQRSMRATFDYSWNLLNEREQDVLRRLAVFRGGFTRPAAQEIVGAGLRELMALVNKSLVHRAPTGRYDMHELMRQYTEEKLGQMPAAESETRERHCACYIAALEKWNSGLRGRQQRAIREEMAVEIGNARAAWDWAVTHQQVARLGRASSGLNRFYVEMGRAQECYAACQAALEALAELNTDDVLHVRAALLGWQCRLTYWAVNPTAAAQIALRVAALLDKLEQNGHDVRRGRADLLSFWIWASRRESVTAGWDLSKEREALYRAVGYQPGVADSLDDLGWAAHEMGRFEEAAQYAEESLAIWRALDNPMGIANELAQLGLIAWVQGRLEESERLMHEGMALRREFGGPFDIAWGLHRLGEALLVVGKFAEARSAVEESIAIRAELGDRGEGQGGSHTLAGEIELHLGYYEQAHSRLRLALFYLQGGGYLWGAGFSHFWLGMAALALQSLAEAHQELQAGLATLRGIGHRENVAWVLAGMGYTAQAVGEPEQARQYLIEALQLAEELDIFVPRLLALPAVALLLADRGEIERTVELYALASRYGFVANSRWFEDVAGRHIAEAAAALPPEVVAAAQERSRDRDLDATVAELLVELEEIEM